MTPLTEEGAEEPTKIEPKALAKPVPHHTEDASLA